MLEKKIDAIASESNIKEWFIIFENRQEGPYTLLELKKDRRFTPDTLVWKKGFLEWIPARLVPEMQELFKDTPESRPLHPQDEEGLGSELGHEQAMLVMQQDPYQIYLWIILFLIILYYTLYHTNS